MIKYPDISVQLSNEDGNAFSIMARVTTAMRRAGIPKQKQEEYQKEASAGDYDNLIQVTMRWVEVA
jgi:hypothetical protein